MNRLVLAVVLSTALLGASLPAIDDARRDHTDTAVRTELDRIERAGTSLLETDAPADEGARRVVTVDLPARSWTDAGVDEVTVSASPTGSGARFTWTVTGGTRNVRHAPDVPLRTLGADAVSLTGSGRHRLVLTLDGNRTDPVVTVRRFTSDEGDSGPYATVATGRERGIGP